MTGETPDEEGQKRRGDGDTPRDADRPARRDLRQDDPGSLPTGVRRTRQDDLRGHSREAEPYEEAPAEGRMAPEEE